MQKPGVGDASPAISSISVKLTLSDAPRFTWISNLVIKICSICAHSSHMAASAQSVGLDKPAISSQSP
ncbi:MAG: hypothetical protein FRX49_01015 [Trebouxia sp. A1-2]|nr:MAG: hypothetical protein FRX49_01015 [Trebouxia sp. A1-2]